MLVSRRKRYLSGSDWVINTLDTLMKSTMAAGNICQVVLVLAPSLDVSSFRQHLHEFITAFPVLRGRVARDFKLTPYWNIPATPVEQALRLTVSSLSNDSDEHLVSQLACHANSPFPYHTEYLDFHLFTSCSRHVLAMRFDHRLLDARGAESFLHLFQQWYQGQELNGDIAFTSSMELTEWRRKFQAGKQVNRALIALSQSVPRSFAEIPMAGGRGCRYRVVRFDKHATAALYERAYREAGYLMESPFFLAVIIQAIHQLFAKRSDQGSCYLIPATIDQRPGKDPLNELFFNHMSYLLYQVPVASADSLAELVTVIKQQMYDQVKSGLPKALTEASLLTRILPLSLFGTLFKLPVNGKLATFAYSHLGKTSYHGDCFMDSGVSGIFHMPRVPVPPGIGFFSNVYDEQLNLVISYGEGLIADEELVRLVAGIRSGLTGEPV